MLKSKTLWFAFVTAVMGVLEQSTGAVTALIGAQDYGLLMLILGLVTAMLRIVTTQPLTEK